MSYSLQQFRDLIERVLAEHDLKSDAAVNLLLGTAAHESRFGTFLRQVRGPALGAFQMELGTFEWLRDKYSSRFPALGWNMAKELEWDLRLAILMARLRYLVVPTPLPQAGDLEGLANYWKQHYNTSAGKGKPEDFIAAYRKYVDPLDA